MNDITLKDLYALDLYEERLIDFGAFIMKIKHLPDLWEVKIMGDKGNWSIDKHLDLAVGYVLMTYYSDNLAPRTAVTS